MYQANAIKHLFKTCEVMITKENLKEVVSSITPKDVKRLNSTNKEYCVIYLNIYNSGFSVFITLTNDYCKYQNVSDVGNCILEVNEVLELLHK